MTMGSPDHHRRPSLRMFLMGLVPPPTARGLFAHKPNPFPSRQHHFFEHHMEGMETPYFHPHREHILPRPPPFIFTTKRHRHLPLQPLATHHTSYDLEQAFDVDHEMMPRPYAMYPGMEKRRHQKTINAPDNHATYMQVNCVLPMRDHRLNTTTLHGAFHY